MGVSPMGIGWHGHPAHEIEARSGETEAVGVSALHSEYRGRHHAKAPVGARNRHVVAGLQRGYVVSRERAGGGLKLPEFR